MVKKKICGITVEIKALNPPRKRDGYAVYLCGEKIAAYRRESTAVHGLAWYVINEVGGLDGVMRISARLSTRKRIEECIVDTWMRTNPKHGGKPSRGGECRGSG
jgi:hypothetical protein